MEYMKVTSNGCILGVAEVASGGNIDKGEFDTITDVIHNIPTAPDGYFYQLKENLELELLEMPFEEETVTE